MKTSALPCIDRDVGFSPEWRLLKRVKLVAAMIGSLPCEVGREMFHAMEDAMKDDIDSRELWDEVLALELSGKLLLVGLTFADGDGTPNRQEQF